MILLAIDPGPTESAIVLYDAETRTPRWWRKSPNLHILLDLDTAVFEEREINLLAVEMVASYGMAVGAEVFDTCVWVGRFIERWGVGPVRQVYRREVKLHLCADSRAKDANIRQALIDRFGGKEQAIGRKASPGPLYGMTGDCWAALAVAVTAAETEDVS